MLDHDADVRRKPPYLLAGAPLNRGKQRRANAAAARIRMDIRERLQVAALDRLEEGETERALVVSGDGKPGVARKIEISTLPDNVDRFEHRGIGAARLLGLAGGDERQDGVAVTRQAGTNRESRKIGTGHMRLLRIRLILSC